MVCCVLSAPAGAGWACVQTHYPMVACRAVPALGTGEDGVEGLDASKRLGNPLITATCRRVTPLPGRQAAHHHAHHPPHSLPSLPSSVAGLAASQGMRERSSTASWALSRLFV